MNVCSLLYLTMHRSDIFSLANYCINNHMQICNSIFIPQTCATTVHNYNLIYSRDVTKRCLAARLEKSVDQINKLMIDWQKSMINPGGSKITGAALELDDFEPKGTGAVLELNEKELSFIFFWHHYFTYRATFCFAASSPVLDSRPVLQSITVGTLLAVTATIT